jgi:hypothetical protein
MFNILSFLIIYYQYLFDKIFLLGTKSGRIPRIVHGPPGAGSVYQNYGTADPDSKEIFTDPQHRFQEGTLVYTVWYILSNRKPCWYGFLEIVCYIIDVWMIAQVS